VTRLLAVSEPPDADADRHPASRDKEELEELLQELRVALPGVQVLLAVLLTVPFNQGFAALGEQERATFFSAVVSAALATILLIAPSAQHRFAWPTTDIGRVVRIGTAEARLGMLALAWTITAASYVVARLIFDGLVGIVTAAVVGCVALALWVALPRAAARRGTVE
jgi:hypothetical protein